MAVAMRQGGSGKGQTVNFSKRIINGCSHRFPANGAKAQEGAIRSTLPAIAIVNETWRTPPSRVRSRGVGSGETSSANI